MKATERPIHCSDMKRMQFYIKDENVMILKNKEDTDIDDKYKICLDNYQNLLGEHKNLEFKF